MPLYQFPPATYIRTAVDLTRLAEKLSQETLLGVDTESNNIHAYQEQVCLIQISTRDKDYIIDPILIEDVSVLGPLMASEKIEKIFHAAEYDISSMRRDFDFTFNNVFDTMIAARLCGFQNIGLATLLEDLAGVYLDKTHQRDDWYRRPLMPDSLHYAQRDTHFLPYLRDELLQMLEAKGHLEEARELFRDASLTPATPVRAYDPDGFWKIGLPNLLKRREMLILKEVYEERDRLARIQNLPPHRVIPNTTLVTIAQTRPRSMMVLSSIEGMIPVQLRLYGESILEAVNRGKAAKELPPAPRHRPPPAKVMERYAALHAWRKEKSETRGIAADIIISKNTLWELAKANPESLEDLQAIAMMGPWRLANYGEEMLAVLETCRSYERG